MRTGRLWNSAGHINKIATEYWALLNTQLHLTWRSELCMPQGGGARDTDGEQRLLEGPLPSRSRRKLVGKPLELYVRSAEELSYVNGL